MSRADLIGHEFATYEFPVEAGKVLEFATAVLSTDPASVTGPCGAQGEAGPVAPPTFSAAALHWASRQPAEEGLGLDLRRVLAAGSQWDYSVPVVAGDVLRVSGVVSGVEHKQGRRGGMTLITRRNRFVNQRDELAFTVESTMIELDQAPADRTDQPAGEPPVRSASAEQAPAAAGTPAPDASATFGPITRTDIVRYAGAGGDFNPIHHDEPFAQHAGYRTVFAHGLLTAGVLSSFAVDWLGRESLRRFAVRYVDQVWPDDTLVTSGWVRDRRDTVDGEELTCELLVHARSGDEERIVLRGTAVAVGSAAGGQS